VSATKNYRHSFKCLKFVFVIDLFLGSRSGQGAYKYHEDSLQILIINNCRYRQTQTANKTSKSTQPSFKMKISNIIPLFAALAAVKAQIAPGLYTIRSLATDERGFVGRSPNEDTSINPKPILLLDNGNIDLASSCLCSGSLFLISFSGMFDLRLRAGIA
jgi:hypothetical protein